MMRRIGFIDIHPRDAASSPPLEQEGVEWQDNALIYIFKDYSGRYGLEETIEYSSDEIPADIVEFYLSVPVELLNFRIINLPYSDKETLRKILPLELESLIIANPQELVFDTVILNGAESGFDVLAVYARKSSFDTLIRKLVLKNIDPRIITSIDLREIINTGAGEPIAGRLANLEMPVEFDRVKAAEKEIVAPTINLRTGTLAYTKDIAKRKRALRKTAILGILLAVVINANIVFNLAMTGKEVSLRKKEIRNMYTALFPGEKRIVDELYQMKSHIREMKEKSDALAGVNPLKFLLELSQKPAGGVVYNEIQIEKGLIKMKAEATSMEAVDRVRSRLSEFLSDVSVTDIKPAPNGRVFSTVAAKEKPR
ncbi:MAG: GspL/Epsl periplasmic domain-containing protein [Syntrophales bacterium]|nr:GspL/Epsl periplasmic domain-containing protein [Syntrophales bacterium]